MGHLQWPVENFAKSEWGGGEPKAIPGSADEHSRVMWLHLNEREDLYKFGSLSLRIFQTIFINLDPFPLFFSFFFYFFLCIWSNHARNSSFVVIFEFTMITIHRVVIDWIGLKNRYKICKVAKQHGPNNNNSYLRLGGPPISYNLEIIKKRDRWGRIILGGHFIFVLILLWAFVFIRVVAAFTSHESCFKNYNERRKDRVKLQSRSW